MATEHSHLCGKKKKYLPHRRKSEWWGVGGRNTKSAEGSCCVRSICQHEVTEVGRGEAGFQGRKRGALHQRFGGDLESGLLVLTPRPCG